MQYAVERVATCCGAAARASDRNKRKSKFQQEIFVQKGEGNRLL